MQNEVLLDTQSIVFYDTITFRMLLLVIAGISATFWTTAMYSRARGPADQGILARLGPGQYRLVDAAG